MFASDFLNAPPYSIFFYISRKKINKFIPGLYENHLLAQEFQQVQDQK